MQKTLFAIILACAGFVARNAAAQLPASMDQVLQRAGTNRDEIARALEQAPPGEGEGVQFLVTNMPDFDLKRLSSDFILYHVDLGYAALRKAPWSNDIPNDVFLNDILPYSCINETRDASADTLAYKCA